MNSPYGTAVLTNGGIPAWAYPAPPPSGAGRIGLPEKVFVLTLLLAGALAYLLYRTEYTYAALGVVGVPFLIGCILEPRVGMYAYCFWQAWDSAVVFGNVKQGAWLTPGKLLAFCVLGIGLVHLLRRRVRFSVSRGVLGWAWALCTIALLSSVWSYDVLRSLRFGGQMLVQLVLLMIMAGMISTDPAYVKRLAFWTIVGGATAGSYIVLFGTEQRAFDRATLSEQANPVSAAVAMVVAMGCVPVLWGLTRSRLVKLSLIAVFLVMLTAIVGTGTRAALGGILGACAAAAVLAGGSGRLKRMALMTVALIIAYGFGAAMVYSSLVPEQAATRLAEFMRLPLPKEHSHWAGKTSGTREYVWALAMEGFERSGWMGSGIGSSAYASMQAEGRYRDVHSNVLGAFVEMGPLGLACFIGLYVAMVLPIRRLREPWLQVAAWMILLPPLAVGLVHTTYTTKWFWLPLTFLVMLFELYARSSAYEDARAMVAQQRLR